MQLTDLPGFKSGQTVRNVLVAAVYLMIGMPLAVIVIPFAIVLSPIIVGIAVWRNYRGAAEKTARIPGISPTGGVKSGAAAFGVMLIALVVISAAAPGDTTQQSAAPSANESTDAGEAEDRKSVV